VRAVSVSDGNVLRWEGETYGLNGGYNLGTAMGC